MFLGILGLSYCQCIVKNYIASLFLSHFHGLVVDVLGSSHVEQVKMESLTLLSGMRVKGPLRELIRGSASGLWALYNLIQLKIDFWLLVMISPLNFGTWTMFNF